MEGRLLCNKRDFEAQSRVVCSSCLDSDLKKPATSDNQRLDDIEELLILLRGQWHMIIFFSNALFKDAY